MSFTFVTPQVTLARNAGALYNYGLGNELMASLASSSDINGLLNSVYMSSVGNAGTSQVAKTLVANLGITGDGVAGAEAYVVAQLNSVAAAGRGKVINDILMSFSSLTGDATYGAAATAWNAKVANAVAYAAMAGSKDTTFAAAVPPTVEAPSFMLTADSASVNEGGTSFFTLSTKGVAAGTQYGYAIKGVSGSDVMGSVLAGTATVGADGKAIIAVSLANDTLTEGDETMTLEIAGQSAAVTVQDTSLSPVVPFTLTTGTNTFTGGAADDLFDGSLSGTSMTFGSSDALDGGAGTDTLSVAINAAGIYQAASIKNIENITVNDAAGGTLSLLGVTGVSSVTSSGSTSAATVSNIGATTTTLGVTNSAVGATFTFTAAAVAGKADTATLTLSGQTAGTNVIAGIETLNIVSSGAANAVTALTTAAATKFVTSGDQTLSLGTLGGTVLTVDSSAATAGVTYTVPNNTTAVTLTGGSGNDSFTLTGGTAVNDSIDAGAGNDTVTVALNLANTDTINGGDGTDVLSSTSTLLTGYTAPAKATISNFETLKVSDALAGGLTTATVQAGISTVDLAGGSGAQTLTLEAGTKTVKIGAANTGSLTISDTGTAITDTLTVTNSAAATNVLGGNAIDLIVNGFETVTINTSGTGAATAQTLDDITLAADAGGTTTLNVTGSNSLVTSTSGGGTGVITATVIDASGLTGTAVLTMAAAAASGLTKITGSANGDTLVGDASSSIDGGAGNDAITGGSGNDTLVGGDGNDSITSGAGNDNINGGAGNDTLTLAGSLATGDVIDGGDGTDTLSLTNASLSTLNGYAISAATNLNNAISNVERLYVSDAFDLGAAFDMARADSLNYITLKAGTTGAEELSGVAANSTIVVGDDSTLTATLGDATGTADVVNFSLVDLDGTADNETVAALVTSGIETVNISATEATADAANVRVYTVTTLTATGSTAVNISGTESVTVTNATSLKAVDASGLTAGTLSISVANAALGATVTGGAGADTITGSANDDVLTGNAGADSIVGAAGNDTVSGGSGADALLAGGTGNDSITGGEGADSIAGGAGNDTIVLTEDVATSDAVYIGSTDTASTNVAIGATNIDTITGFAAGASGDILRFDIGTVVVSSATEKIATLSTDGTTLTSLANTAVAGDVDILIVLGEFGSYAAVQTQMNSTAAAITDATNGAIVLWKDGAGNTQVYYDTDISAGAGTGTQMATLVGVNTASLVAANLDVIA